MIIGNLRFLFNGESADLSERLEKRRTRIDFIINPIEGAYFFNNAKIHKIL